MRALVLYATITGNNEDVADEIIKNFQSHGVEVTKEDIINADPYDLQAATNDIVVVVPYTFDKGSLPDEALDFYEDLAMVDLHGQIFGVAGSGDVFYGADFAKAVDKFEAQFIKAGASQGAPSVRVNLSPNTTAKAELKQFTDTLIARVVK
ncbi:flavodoxin [Weissella oryzae SG25]|uniref:Flavodoxin n=1 Tax=Weissella oryzae (strain DSM 25784 / JCM 18191 / LMG 30913 / SG25) TaxID=1329250 RepID=A0A069CSZ9_WEIOS|nr:flavodoxin domain-containing protein [Weissella oryzae]GAK30599.1 flavodoxin [Weissella oryzae SG25]